MGKVEAGEPVTFVAAKQIVKILRNDSVGSSTAYGQERISDDSFGETETVRDQEIYKMREFDSKNMVTLYRQIQFIQTRLQAYEIVTFEMSLIDVIKSLFSRKALREKVDQVQIKLIQEHDQLAKESIEKKKEESSKPKLTIVGANGISKLAVFFIAGLFASGCISLKKHNKIVSQMAHDNSNANALLEDCKKVSKSKDNELRAKTERLKRFNQLDDKGNLRPLRPWKGDKDPEGWDGPDGSEPWLK